jgi:hypothetical protein
VGPGEGGEGRGEEVWGGEEQGAAGWEWPASGGARRFESADGEEETLFPAAFSDWITNQPPSFGSVCWTEIRWARPSFAIFFSFFSGSWLIVSYDFKISTSH